MLRIQTIGLALMAAFALSAVAASSASAAHLWLINGTALTSSVKVHSLGLLLLEDTKTGTKVHCHGYDTGTVGPHALDLVEKITAELLGTNNTIPCSFDKVGLCNSSPAPTAIAVHLPWHTELYLEGAEVRDHITSDGAGEPGWAITCEALGGPKTDTCTNALNSTGVENVTGGVKTTFDVKTLKANCSIGGAGTGKVEGSNLVESPSASEPLMVEL